MKPVQVLGPPCQCGECRQAGAGILPAVVNDRTGEQLHGYALKRWHEAREKFLADFKRAAGVPFSEAS